MSDYTDTMLNLWVFLFIAVAIWLAIKPATGLDTRNRQTGAQRRHRSPDAQSQP